MALDLRIRVTDRETGNPTDMFTHIDLTAKELGMLHMLEEALMFGKEIILVDLAD
jgi:hypothetical protein